MHLAIGCNYLFPCQRVSNFTLSSKFSSRLCSTDCQLFYTLFLACIHDLSLTFGLVCLLHFFKTAFGSRWRITGELLLGLQIPAQSLLQLYRSSLTQLIKRWWGLKHSQSRQTNVKKFFTDLMYSVFLLQGLHWVQIYGSLIDMSKEVSWQACVIGVQFWFTLQSVPRVLKLSCFLSAEISCFRRLWSIPPNKFKIEKKKAARIVARNNEEWMMWLLYVLN